MKTEDRQKFRDDIHGYLDKAMDRLEDKYDRVNVRVGEAREKTNRFVHENPKRSLLIAAGVGSAILLTIGMLMKKNRRCQGC